VWRPGRHGNLLHPMMFDGHLIRVMTTHPTRCDRDYGKGTTLPYSPTIPGWKAGASMLDIAPLTPTLEHVFIDCLPTVGRRPVRSAGSGQVGVSSSRPVGSIGFVNATRSGGSQ
jgi:hypothetical protein